MKARRSIGTVSLAMAVGWAVLCPAAGRATAIRHEAPGAAARGQPLTIRAHVAAEQALQAVRLHYTTSRDVAPASSPMVASGGDVYIGTIPASALAAATSVLYYVEALDAGGALKESAWYTVPVRDASGGADAGGGESGRAGWVTPALIAGGAAVVVGGVALAGGLGGGGDDGDSSGGSGAAAEGSYSGPVTTVTQETGGGTSAETHSATVTISAARRVYSDTLRPGVPMETSLSGSSFVLRSTVSEPDRSGEIRYVGTVVDNRIVGTVE